MHSSLIDVEPMRILHAKCEARQKKTGITGRQEDRSRHPSPSSAEKRASQRARAPSGVDSPMTCARVWQTCIHFLQQFLSSPADTACSGPPRKFFPGIHLHSFRQFIQWKVFVR